MKQSNVEKTVLGLKKDPALYYHILLAILQYVKPLCYRTTMERYIEQTR